MNKTKIQKLIRFENNQDTYNRELKNIIDKLQTTHISSEDTQRSGSKPITIGDQVRMITNPNRFGGKKGTVFKITKTRVNYKRKGSKGL